MRDREGVQGAQSGYATPAPPSRPVSEQLQIIHKAQKVALEASDLSPKIPKSIWRSPSSPTAGEDGHGWIVGFTEERGTPQADDTIQSFLGSLGETGQHSVDDVQRAADAKNLFKLYDADSDGWLNKAEIVRVVHALKPDRSILNVARIMSVWDTNSDGQVSESEFVARIVEIAASVSDWAVTSAGTLARLQAQAKVLFSTQLCCCQPRWEHRNVTRCSAHATTRIDAVRVLRCVRVLLSRAGTPIHCDIVAHSGCVDRLGEGHNPSMQSPLA